MSIVVNSPYNNVVFSGEGAHIQAKAELHTHTICSDSSEYVALGKPADQTPVNLVNKYADYGYDVVAITDHDTVDESFNNKQHGLDDFDAAGNAAPGNKKWVHKPYPTFPLSDFPNYGEEALSPASQDGEDVETYAGLGATEDKSVTLIRGIELTQRTWYCHHLIALFTDLWNAADVAAGYIRETPIDPVNAIQQWQVVGAGTNDKVKGDAASLEWEISEVGRRGGLLIFSHPGYHNKYFKRPRYDTDNYSFYVNHYKNHPHAIGQNVRTATSFVAYAAEQMDEAAWDAVLVQLMPNRPVWGFSDGDVHNMSTCMGANMNILLVPALTRAEIYSAIRNGQFYCVADPEGLTVGRHTASPPTFPTISNIEVDEEANTITITANNATNVRWVFDGKNIAYGNVLKYGNKDITYVRAELDGADSSIAFTQPFGLSEG